MALSKSSRLIILLVIDSIFFFIELSIGYAVHSLALVADSFHMLNDVLSLLVGLWAVKVANRTSSKMYTYGWQRAETLGALVNGVFLVALCVTIFLDAIQRFVEPTPVTQPKLVLIVGCLGLASNLLGLLLFHDHSHSHGGDGHDHGAEGHNHDVVKDAEEGHAHSHRDEDDRRVADETGNVVDVLPQNRIGGWPTTKARTSQTEDSEATAVEPSSSINVKRSSKSKHKHSRTRSIQSGFDEIHVNPRSFRESIIAASHPPIESDDDEEDESTTVDANDDEGTPDHAENQGLLHGKAKDYGSIKRKPIDHKEHKHRQPREAGKSGGHGHSHGDLNMKGIFLHVMGDALGNIGVIATALIIWLTDLPGKYYADPAISLVITVIILCSAIPLCKAASRILLQAVPLGINVDDISEDIEDLPGIISCHHVHVWQLNDTKIVASLHIQVGFDFKGEGSARYMQLAQAIRQCLHEYGIHSSTIQPEFCLDPDHDHAAVDGTNDARVGSISPPGSTRRSHTASKAGSVREPAECLLECGDECGGGNSCCPAPLKDNKDAKHDHDGHDHAH
nr:zinc/cadmium resistance protein [Quercus suber]